MSVVQSSTSFGHERSSMSHLTGSRRLSCITSCPCWSSSCILDSFVGDDDVHVHVNVHVNETFTSAASWGTLRGCIYRTTPVGTGRTWNRLHPTSIAKNQKKGRPEGRPNYRTLPSKGQWLCGPMSDGQDRPREVGGTGFEPVTSTVCEN
jgi:hypothetical protein